MRQVWRPHHPLFFDNIENEQREKQKSFHHCYRKSLCLNQASFANNKCCFDDLYNKNIIYVLWLIINPSSCICNFFFQLCPWEILNQSDCGRNGIIGLMQEQNLHLMSSDDKWSGARPWTSTSTIILHHLCDSDDHFAFNRSHYVREWR